MKLTYDILWFEDQFEQLQPSINRLVRFVESQGLVPNIEKRNSITEDDIYELGDRLENSNPYDLIICDFDMGKASLNGVEIAVKLRANVYTDMVFYSGKIPDDINQLVFDNSIQGVFVIHKPNFYAEISPLIKDHIKKLSSLNGARGMIMSEWSEIELALRGYLSHTVSTLEEEARLKQEKKILARLIEQTKRRLKTLEKTTDVSSLLSNSMQCDFSIIRRSLISLFDEVELFKNDAEIHRMQDERNLLAHNKQQLLDNGSLLVNAPNGQEKVYNIEEFKTLRISLINLHSQLSKIL